MVGKFREFSMKSKVLVSSLETREDHEFEISLLFCNSYPENLNGYKYKYRASKTCESYNPLLSRTENINISLYNI